MISEGEWYVNERFIMSSAHKVKVIAEVPQHGIRQAKVDKANARLIAAAPKLLKACKRLKKIIVESEGNIRWDANYSFIEQAIQSAEGGK